MTGLVNRLRGQVRIRAECAFPERVLNLCSARNLAFWDLEWESATAFTCRVSRQDYRVLRQAAEKLDCTMTAGGGSLLPAAVSPPSGPADRVGGVRAGPVSGLLFRVGF